MGVFAFEDPSKKEFRKSNSVQYERNHQFASLVIRCPEKDVSKRHVRGLIAGSPKQETHLETKLTRGNAHHCSRGVWPCNSQKRKDTAFVAVNPYYYRNDAVGPTCPRRSSMR